YGIGNYLVFSGLTAANITIEATTAGGLGSGNPPRAPINAIQLIASQQLLRDLLNGFSLIANPLSRGQNTLNEVLQGLPGGTTIFFFDTLSNRYSSSVMLSDSWVPNVAVPPGKGFFIAVGRPATVLFQGQALSGTLSNPTLPGFNLLSSKW